MRTKSGILLSGILSAVFLVACGGDDIFTPVAGQGPSGAPVAEIGKVRLILSNPVLNSGVDTVADSANPAEAVTVTAIVTDKNSRVVPGQDVAFSLPNQNATLQVINATTDASGAARAFLTNGGNVLDRSVTVRAEAGKVVSSIDVTVDGTAISLTGPASLGLGSRATYRVRLTNGRGVDSPTSGGIAGQSILVSSDPATALSVIDTGGQVTNNLGVLEFEVEGTRSTPSGMPEVLSVSALNEEASLPVAVSQFSINLSGINELQEVKLGDAVDITVTLTGSGGPAGGQRLDFGASRGTVTPSGGDTDSNGRFNIRYVAAGGTGRALIRVFGPSGSVGDVNLTLTTDTPFRVDLQADPGGLPVNGTSLLTATVRDDRGNLVKGQAVEFNLQDVTGGTLSTPRALTDAQGRATVTYTASSSPSGNRAVVVRAYTTGAYSATDGSTCNDTDGDGSDSENSDSNAGGSDSNLLCDQIGLTVGGLALRVALGTGNTLAEPTETTYTMPWSALVTDSAGNPAPPGTSLRLKITPLAFQKGYFIFPGTDGPWIPQYQIGIPLGDPPSNSFGDGCTAEDLNENGILDVSEDFNRDGVLTPSNVASVPQGVGANNDEVTLTPEGFAFFDIAYAQQYAKWVRVRLTAIATVEGTETIESAVVVLPGIASDYSDETVSPPGSPSPFGESDVCTDTR